MSAYKLRPYVATMFKNILRLGDMGEKLVSRRVEEL